MRTFTLTLLLTCVFGCVALAEDQPRTAGKTESATDMAKLFAPQLPVSQPQFRTWLPLGPLQFRTRPPRRVPVVPQADECYTMRSYQMKREGNTDVTRQRGYTTCTPSARFRVKPVPASPQP